MALSFNGIASGSGEEGEGEDGRMSMKLTSVAREMGCGTARVSSLVINASARVRYHSRRLDLFRFSSFRSRSHPRNPGPESLCEFRLHLNMCMLCESA